MSSLSTHILDLTHGKPAAGVDVRLLKDGAVILRRRTNADGRLDQGPDGPSDLAAGAYRLEFDVGPYFRGLGLSLAEPAFIETAVIEFNIAAGQPHYHVPLLVSPFGYSTYRGS